MASAIDTRWWQDPNTPEQFGFLKNQVQPFNIVTPDGETLYTWHVVPIAKYIANEDFLINDDTDAKAFNSTVAFDLLSKDPNNEQGLIVDGVAAVQWAMDVAKIPPQRIALVGASLGTAVATAVAEQFSRVSQIDFAGVVLVATFSDVPALLLTYSIGGFIPILSPLRPYPALQKLFLGYLKDTWQTSSRLASLVRLSRTVNLHLIHSKNDFEIPWKHTEGLFYTSANATSLSGLSNKQIDGVKLRKDLGHDESIESWNADGAKKISKHIVRYGGHNRVATYPHVARAIQEIFDL
ncbi:MAG: hypothetical protein Q9170_007511 [Blastenia crenularia]